MAQSLPVLGAAMPSSKLPDYSEWLINDQRDLEIQDPTSHQILDGDWHSIVKQIRALLDGYTGRMGVHGPFWSLTLAAIDPKIRAVVQERLKQGLDFCAEIGGSHMVIHSPHAFLGTPHAPLSTVNPYMDYRQIILDTLAPVVEQAQQYRITLMMETIFDRDMSIWIDTVKALDSDYVRASVDVGHTYINYQLGAPPPDYWVLEAGKLLGHLHLQDSDGYADRHWVPGDGQIQWHSIFQALSTLDQQPRLIIEIADHSEICRAADWFAAQGLAR